MPRIWHSLLFSSSTKRVPHLRCVHTCEILPSDDCRLRKAEDVPLERSRPTRHQCRTVVAKRFRVLCENVPKMLALASFCARVFDVSNKRLQESTEADKA